MAVHITLTPAQAARIVKRLTARNHDVIKSDASAYFQVELHEVEAVEMPAGVAVTFNGATYSVVKHTPSWLGHNGYVFLDTAGEVAQPLPYVAPATPAYAKSIQYDRETRDYAMYLDTELVGFARTYQEAEMTLDQLVFELLMHPQPTTDTVERHRQTLADTADMEADHAASLV